MLDIPLEFHGTLAGNGSWVDGVLKGDDFLFPVYDGVPLFIDLSSINRSKVIESASKFLDLVRNNWSNARKQYRAIPLWETLCKEIASCNDIILEIGVGPGGGFMPCVLDLNEEAKILANDIDYSVIFAWRKFLKEKGISRNVSFAVFDATRMPLKSNSFDVVASFGGIANIPFNYFALMEAHRVLKPSGRLVLVEGVIPQEDFNNLPNEVKIRWLSVSPFMVKGYKAFLEKLGFKIKLYEVYGEKTLLPEDSELARIASNYNVTLRFRGVYIIALKT